MSVAASTSDPYIGRTFGNVRLVKKIGQGGMGMVYLGQHERFSRDVAVKLLPQHHDEKKLQYQKRFLREGRTAAGIHHRNVVQVMDAGAENGVAYLVLEFVNGRSIGEVLDEQTKMAPDIVERMAVEMAEGLKAIHACDVIHRDIKPDNVLLTKDNQIKITDLGLARQLNDPEVNRLTATGMVVGTPLYVAPEAIRDTKSAGPKTDIYSLGCTLYHMLGGKPPFLGKTPFDVMRSHLDQRPEPLRQLDPNIPKHLANLVHLCLSKDPEERPSPGEIVRILRERHMVRDGGSRTTVMLLIAAAVAVISLAALAWQFMGEPHADSAATLANQSTAIRIDVSPPPGATFRIDDGPWHDLKSDLIPVPPGSHNILIAATENGTYVQAMVEVELQAGDQHLVELDFQPVTVQKQMYRFDIGSGMIYVVGEARGMDDQITFNQIGSYSVARFDGQQFWSTVVEVTPTELVASQPERSSAAPEGFFLSSVDQRSVPTHHLCCWQEVEWARKDAGIAGPMSWSTGQSQPSQEALNMDALLVQATGSWAKRFGLEIPDAETAAELQRAYGAPVWRQDDRKVSPWPSNATPGNTFLLLVPTH